MFEWISVKDKLPEKEGLYIVCFYTNKIGLAEFFNDDPECGCNDPGFYERWTDGTYDKYDDEVAFWMFPPKPPKVYMNEFYYEDLIKIERNAYKQFEKHSLVTIFIKFNNGEEFKYDVVSLAFELFDDENNFIHFITNDGRNYNVHMSEVLSFRTNAAGAL